MTGEHDSLRWTRSDVIAETVSAESCHVILETLSPECVEKISRYLESSAGQKRQDKVSNEPAEAESDSGDSLFITQKPVPEAVRSARPRHYSSRSEPISPRALEDSEEDSLSDSFHRESQTDKRRRKKKHRLPKYSFPFLSGRERKPRSTLLAGQQNKHLHNYAMGGFFKCVKELWQDYGRGNLESSLPTVDMDEDYISPLSEEEERSEEEDIKVVERKCLVAPSKAKSRQTWWNQLKEQSARKSCNARQENSQGRHKLQDKTSISKSTVLSSETENSDDEGSSCRVVVERERNDEHMASNGNFTPQAPKTNRQFQQNAREKELCKDRDATVCEPLTLQRSPRLYTRKGKGASTTVREPHTDVFLLDDLFQTGQAEVEHESQHLLPSLSGLVSDTNKYSETRVRKRKNKKKDKGDCESVGEKKSQSQEELKGLHAITSVSVEVEETPSLSEDNREKPPASQASDELEFNENNWMGNSSRDDNIIRQREGDIPNFKIKKKKRKKSKSAENVQQEVDGTSESDVRNVDSVFSVSCNVEHGGKEKRKKKKRSGEDGEAVESQASTVAQPLIDDANVMRKKKKRKKDERIVITQECEGEEASNRTLDLPPVSTGQLEDSGNCLENTAASQETFESSYVKRKKHRKREMSSNEATQDGEEGVSYSNDAVTLAKSTAMSLKKKKRKTISEGVGLSQTPENNENVHNSPKTKEGIEDQNAELGTKKKKKKKKTLSEAVDVSCIPKENDEVENVDNIQKTKEGVQDQNAELVTKKKKKKKTLSEAVDDSCIVEENEEVEKVDNTQKTKEGIEKQNAELVTKKKKKKMDEVSSRNISRQDSVAQSDDSVSVRKKAKKRTSSFLVADAEENDARTQEEQNSPGEYEPESAQTTGNMAESNDGVRKKKRKKISVAQDSVEKDQDFEDPNKTCQSTLPETTDMRVKRKKKRIENESELVTPMERLESAADVGHSLTDETVLLKKKKKKKKCKDEPCHVVQESPPKKKGKQLALPLVAESCSVEVSHDGSTCDQATKEALNMAEHASSSSETPGYQTLNETMDKRKKKKMKLTDDVLFEGKSLTKSGVLEPLKNKKKQSAVPNIISSSPMLSETSMLKSEMSSSDRIMKNKHVKVKRRLYNPSEDFLTDC